MFWTLLIVVTLKYLTFILRVDNKGEGGVIALTALVRSGKPKNSGKRWVLLLVGLFGASLLYGDGMITPTQNWPITHFTVWFHHGRSFQW